MGRSCRTAVAKGDREKKPFFSTLLCRFFSSSLLLGRFYCFVFASCPAMAASAAAAAAAAGGAGQPGKRKCAGWSSALPLLLLLAVALAGMATPAAAAEYKVGDSAGWTVGSVNYTAWAASKIFHVGDTISFEYNKQVHNVLEVSPAAYGSCSTGSPKATHNTGNDTIALQTAGHHYFLCGFPGHCGFGQKVDVNVLASASPAASPGSTPSSVPPASSPAAGGGTGEGPTPTPPPAKSRAAPGASGSYVVGCAVASLAVAVSLLRLWLG